MVAPLERVKALLAALPKEDQAELRRYLGDILVTGDEAEGILVASLEARAPGGRRVKYTYRSESVRCGKAACWCAQATLGHGPYTYKYWREAGGRLRKQYVGKAPGVSSRRVEARGARARGSSAASSSGPAPRA